MATIRTARQEWLLGGANLTAIKQSTHDVDDQQSDCDVAHWGAYHFLLAVLWDPVSLHRLCD